MDVQSGTEDEPPVVRAQVHLGVDVPVGREDDVPLCGQQRDRAHEAGRPAGGDQLLRVGADAGFQASKA